MPIRLKTKRRVLITVSGLIVVSAFFIACFISQKYVVPIIMYHSVNPSADGVNRLAVKNTTFARQMDFLKKHHYNVLPLEELAALLKEKKKLPPKAISITFDDGYKDNFTYAFGILKKYNLPATMFIIVNEVGRFDRLSWEEIKIMQNSGLVVFGSHTVGPEPLINIKSKEELKKQIFDSKRILEEKLGTKIRLFSYPEGRFNEEIRQLVIDAGYIASVATNPGKNYPDDDIFALKRLRISENSANMFIFAVETSGFYTFMKEWRRRKR